MPHRSEIISKRGPVNLDFPTPIEHINGYEVVDSDDYAFVIGFTSTGNVFVFKSNKTESTTLSHFFTLNHLGGSVVAATVSNGIVAIF